MNDDNLGPQPDPVIEDKEPNPGGVDAVPDAEEDVNLPRDLTTAENPAVDSAVPDEITQLDDKSQAPDGKAADSDAGTQDDPDAGQEAEDGSVEPPA